MSFAYLLKAFSDLFFPRACPGCGDVDIHPEANLCRKCCISLHSVRGLYPQSRQKSNAVRRTVHGYYYEKVLKELITRLKYGGELHLADVLSDYLIQVFSAKFNPNEYDAIVPVPMHKSGLFKRGFNQALLLSEAVADVSGISLHRRSLIKIKNTAAQAGLNRNERRSNLKGCFAVSDKAPLKNKRILLIDDVSTTGATIHETSATIMKAGAMHVDALTLAYRDFTD